jgi:hypothetical protein
MILTALAPLLMAQGLPRPLCGYGEGLAHLRATEREAAQPVPGITEGRSRGERALTALGSAAGTFQACGCARLAELTLDAITVAQSLPAEASLARLAQVFAQTRYRTQLAREFSERQGCQ